jgi:hypothetical protein
MPNALCSAGHLEDLQPEQKLIGNPKYKIYSVVQTYPFRKEPLEVIEEKDYTTGFQLWSSSSVILLMTMAMVRLGKGE